MIYIHIIAILIFATNQIQSQSTLQRIHSTELKLSTYAGRQIKQLASNLWNVERGVEKLVSAKWSHMEKDEYLGTPLTALVMVRRLAQDWPPLATMVGRFSKLRHLQLGEVKWPTRLDFEVTARAMMRSQLTYDLNTALLVRGVQGDAFLTNVTASDCLEIARQYFRKELYSNARVWLQHALTEANGDEEASFRETALYYMAAALCLVDDARGSLTVLNNILVENPRSKLPEALVDIYTVMSTKGCVLPDGRPVSATRYNMDDSIEFYRNKNSTENHGRLCRGEGKVDSRLRCRYVHHGQPHLRFQPFKMEELQLDPPVLRFYDLVSDNESGKLLRQAKKQMGPATVGTGPNQRVSEYRTSEVAWLGTDGNDWLSRRIGDVTQLDPHFAEHHQVSRYSMSGEYLPHWDHFEHNANTVDWGNDRIATLMFYLNDVEQGGNTIFTRWNLSIPPVKNSAVLWFNYKPNGEGDQRSEHGGCPVLKGTKWVLNKWIHNKGNDVNFPCTLDQHGSFKGFYL